MELILIRHGQSLGNVGLCDHCDCDLSEVGVRQAQELGLGLSGEFDLKGFAGLVSPYLRARRTAGYVSEGTGLTFAIHEGCREWGKDCSPAGDLYPEETLEGAIGRVAEFVASLDRSGRYVIVSHAAPVFMMAQLASGADVVETLRRCEGPFWDRIGNCAVTQVKEGELVCLSRYVAGV
jgi:broad specificity phosphatase PhoE